MKTFETDKPSVRYFLLGLGFIVGSIVGVISTLLLAGVILK